MNEQIVDRAAQEALMGLAGSAIVATVRDRPNPTIAQLDELRHRHPALGMAAGGFVTIYVAAQLRGCLGEIETEDTLADVVVRCASRVPRHDHRFRRIAAVELARLSFKVSILSPPRRVESIDRIRIGTHGLIVRHEGRVGLLLPEVPLDYGWDVPTFLLHLWRKAGIGPAVTAEEACLWSFTSQVVSSDDFPALSPAPSGLDD